MTCVRAPWPTSDLSAEGNQTTDGSMKPFSLMGTSLSLPCASNHAADVFVVPKSIPRIGAGAGGGKPAGSLRQHRPAWQHHRELAALARLALHRDGAS